MNNQQDNNNRDIHKEKLREAGMKLIKVGSVMIAIAIVTLCYGLAKVDDDLTRTVVYSIGWGLALIGAFLIFTTISAMRSLKNRRNFFLYDKKKKSDIAPSELTFDTVREKICEFMSIFKHRGKLYVGDILSDNAVVPEHFKPLFCYELLYELSTGEGMDAGVFLSFGDECATVFAKYLRQNEDYELANTIYSYISDFSAGNRRIAEFKAFMSDKCDHIRAQMLKYAKDNIEKFN